MWRHQVFWPRSCLCHPLQQLEVVLSTSKNSGGDWGHPAQFCHSCMGPLFQTGDSVGDDETRSGFLQNCSRELSQSLWCHDSKTLKRIRSRQQPNKLRFSRFTSSSPSLRGCKYFEIEGWYIAIKNVKNQLLYLRDHHSFRIFRFLEHNAFYHFEFHSVREPWLVFQANNILYSNCCLKTTCFWRCFMFILPSYTRGKVVKHGGL